MPYIAQERRSRFKKAMGDLIGQMDGPWDLNYVMSVLARKYVKFKSPVSYTLLNEVVGVFELAKLEFYRTVAVPFEKTKIIENGDI